MLRPVRKLIGYAGRLEAGDLAARPNVRASGEIGALGRALAVSAASIGIANGGSPGPRRCSAACSTIRPTPSA